MVRAPGALANNTILLFLTGLIIGSLALLADLIVRSRADEDRPRRARLPVQGRRGPAHHRAGAPARRRRPRRGDRVVARPVPAASTRASRRSTCPRARPSRAPGAGWPGTARTGGWPKAAACPPTSSSSPSSPRAGPRLPRDHGRLPPARHRGHLPQRPAARAPPRRRAAHPRPAQPRGHGAHPLRRPGRPGPRPGPGRDGADRNHASPPARHPPQTQAAERAGLSRPRAHPPPALANPPALPPGRTPRPPGPPWANRSPRPSPPLRPACSSSASSALRGPRRPAPRPGPGPRSRSPSPMAGEFWPIVRKWII